MGASAPRRDRRSESPICIRRPRDVTRAHTLAEAWKDYDPAALSAAAGIRTEVSTRYGIDTRDTGTDTAFLESWIDTGPAGQARREALAEHRKAIALIAATQAEDLRAKTRALAPDIEHHNVPAGYLADPVMVQAL